LPIARPISKLISALLMSLRGSVCLYQGEELGLTEADLAFEDLQDPYGIQFWPEFKGRDGCRTPMVWDSQAKPRAASRRRQALAAGAGQASAQAVSVQQGDENSLLEHYRRFLAFRKQPSGALPRATSPSWSRGRHRRLHRASTATSRSSASSTWRGRSQRRPWRPATAAVAGPRIRQGNNYGDKIDIGGYGAWFGRLDVRDFWGGNQWPMSLKDKSKKSYGNLNILHGIDLEIKSGEFIVFVGPSGCGKSTLLRIDRRA
jgi:alpha-glucosidase